MNLDTEDNAKNFFLLWRAWNTFNTDSLYANGFQDKTSIGKCMDCSFNPRKSTVAFVTELIEDGVIVYNKKGKLIFDDDRVEELMNRNKVYSSCIAFFKRDKITF